MPADSADIIYKYRPFNERNAEHIRRVFSDSELYFSSPSQFNDPFDCQVELSLEGTKDEWIKYFTRILKHHRPELRSPQRLREAHRLFNSGKYREIDTNITARVTHGLGICCFSAVRDDILMWSHYAEHHTGVVFGFRAGPDDWFFRRAQRVRYAHQYPVTKIVDGDIERMEATLLTKANHWEYEKEYRVIDYTLGPGVHKFPTDLLSCVILGLRMPEDRRAEIRAWAASHPAKPRILQAIKKKRAFGLLIEEESPALISAQTT